MKLTLERKSLIDRLSWSGVFSYFRFATLDDPWFQGATGKYWERRMDEMNEPTNAELLASYLSDQMSEKEWQEWVRERPELEKLLRDA